VKCQNLRKLCNKRDDLKFSMADFPFICSNIPVTSSYGVDPKTGCELMCSGREAVPDALEGRQCLIP
jgi:hypothetical protein